MRKVKLLWTSTAVAVLSVLALSALPAGAAGPTESLKIDVFEYRPDPLVVSPGELVRVDNLDADRQHSIPHTVTAYSGAFDTGVIWEEPARFRAPAARGVYQYFCELHPDMKGVLRVQAGG